jgi:GT2 family glycosyltransferase
MTNKDLTIIIVTFNSAEIISKCLSYINADKYNVIVVDNASADNTCQIVSEKFSQIKLIKHNKNSGYGRANNIALQQAETEFALILNPDASIFETDIEICLNILKKNPEIALAIPRIFNNQEEANKAAPIKPDFTYINFAYGGTLFMRMSVFKRIGFFDEQFFMFAEDNELSDRSIDNGYKNIQINIAKAFHQGGSSSKKSLRTTYRRFWHLGWSKSKYKENRKGTLNNIRATARLVLVYFCESIFYLLQFNIKRSVEKFAFSAGCFAYLVGLKAFRKDGTARG